MPLIYYLALPIFLIVTWMIVSHTGGIPHILLPSPESVLQTFINLLTDGSLWHHTIASASRSLTGFLLSALFGISLGLILAKNKRSYQLSYLVIESIRVTPPLALIPLLILWLGIDEAPKIAIVFLSSFFPIYFNTLTSVRSVDKKLLEVGQLLQFSSKEIFKYITLPSALPGILTGLRLGFGYSWRALVGAELIAASSGLGYLISESAEFAKTETVFVGIFTIALLGVMADRLLALICHYLIRINCLKVDNV